MENGNKKNKVFSKDSPILEIRSKQEQTVNRNIQVPIRPKEKKKK